MPARQIIITGQVQGVFFRAETKRHAQLLRVTGWIRNCADGSVEIYAEGNDKALEEFLTWCHRGPEGAHVKEVTVKDAPEDNLPHFSIL